MIEADYENKVISAGGYRCDKPNFFPKWNNAPYTLILDNMSDAPSPYSSLYHIKVNKLYKKEMAQYLNAKLGITPSRFVKIWNAKMYDMWIKPYERIIRAFCFHKHGRPKERKGGWHTEWITTIHKNGDLINQAIEDGNENIIPFIILYEKSPQELKKCSVRDCGENYAPIVERAIT